MVGSGQEEQVRRAGIVGLLATLWAGCAQPLQGNDDLGRRGGRADLRLGYGADLGGPPADLSTGAGADLARGADDLAVGPDLGNSAAGVEDCFNDLDDDCDGKVNNGCPDTVTVGVPVPLVAHGGNGGNATSAICPAGSVLTGTRFIVDDFDGFMAGAGVFCSTPTLVRGANAYSITLAPAGGQPPTFAGSYADNQADANCDTTMFQVGWNTLENAGTYVNGLGLDCASGALTLGGNNQLSVAFTNLNNNFGVNYGGGVEYPQACGPSQALVGYNGRIGTILDQIQPVCAPIQFTYK
jgi:hypothetical protein